MTDFALVRRLLERSESVTSLGRTSTVTTVTDFAPVRRRRQLLERLEREAGGREPAAALKAALRVPHLLLVIRTSARSRHPRTDYSLSSIYVSAATPAVRRSRPPCGCLTHSLS